jgi:hypothetical protein
MKRLRSKPTLTVLGLLVTAAVAWAYWTTTGTGSGSATAGTLAPATITAPDTSNGTVGVTWTQQATTGNTTRDADITYTVQRKDGALGTFTPIASGPCSGDLPHGTLSCDDTVGSDGTYTYRVVARYDSWTATSNEESVDVDVGGGDTTAPYVLSLDRAGSSPTNATSVSWTVTFSEAVNGVNAGDFDLVQGGNVSTAAITDVTPTTGPDTTYTVTADTGTGSGSLGLDLDDDNTIEDGAGNDLVGAPPTSDPNGDFTGQVYTLDKTAPTVDSITRKDPTSSLTNASLVKWEVEFTESVSGVNLADFALSQGTGLSGSALASVVQDNGSTYTVTANTGSGDGTLNLNVVDDDSIVDGVGNTLAGGFTGGTASEYHVDKVGPSVSSMTRDNANPTNLGSVSWTVTFVDSSVQGLDATDFALETSGVSDAAITGVTAISGQQYKVTANTGSGSGTIQLNLVDDDTITDQLGNPLGGVGEFGDPEGDGSFFGTASAYTIDKTFPTVQSIARAGTSPTNAGSVSWTVTFSENVTGVNASDFDLVVGSLSGSPAITSVTGSNATYTVTASTGTGNGTLGLDLDDDDTIADGAGNKLGGTNVDNGDFTGGTAAEYVIDKTTPQLVSLEMHDNNGNGRVDRVTATFSETLEPSTNTGPWTLANVPSGGTLSTVSTSASTATLVITEGGGAQNTAVGSFTVALAQNATGIRDAAGNQSSFAAQAPTDKAAPVVTSIGRNGTTPTNAASVGFTAAFSESVTGVDSADFTVPTTGISGASVSDVSGSGASRTVTVGTGTGDGTLGLNLVDDDTIQDAASAPNKLGGTGNGNGNFTGETYTIDKTAPQLVTLAMRDNDTDGLVDRVVATFGETIENSTNAAPWTLANIPSAGTKSTLSTSGSTATLLITEGGGARNTAVGSFTVALAQNATGIRDSAGNQSSFATQAPSDEAKPVPTAVVDANGTNNGRFETNDTLTVTFSEAVTNSATSADIVLNDVSPRDTLAIPGLFEGTTAYDSGENGYISTGTATFPSSALSQPTTSQVRVTLAACSTGCTGLGTENGTGPLVVVPSTTIRDTSSNTNSAAQNSALPTFSIRLF